MTLDGRTLWRDNPDRWADRRSTVLEDRHGLRESVALTLAYSELGYSSSGIATRAGHTTATVQDHFAQIEAELGQAALLAKRPDQLGLSAPVIPSRGESR